MQEHVEDYNNLSSSQISSNEMFIIGGLVSQSSEDKALVKKLENCSTLYIIMHSSSCSISNLSCLTGVEEVELAGRMLALKKETVYKGLSLQKQVLDEFGVYVTLIMRESEALFFLDVFDSNHDYIPTLKSILNLSRQFKGL